MEEAALRGRATPKQHSTPAYCWGEAGVKHNDIDFVATRAQFARAKAGQVARALSSDTVDSSIDLNSICEFEWSV